MVDAFSDSHDDNGVSKPSGIDEDKLAQVEQVAQDEIRNLKHRFRDHVERDRDSKPLFLEMNYEQCDEKDNYEGPLDDAVKNEIRQQFEQAYRAATKDADSSETKNPTAMQIATTAFVDYAVNRFNDELGEAGNDSYREKRRTEAVDYPVVYVVYGNEETGAYDVQLEYRTDEKGRRIWFNEKTERPEAVWNYVDSKGVQAQADAESNDGDGASVAGDDKSTSNGDSQEFPDGVNKDRYKWERGFTVYVGETNEIARRVSEHLKADPSNRGDWETVAKQVEKTPGSYKQILISDQYFTKSMTEDIEDRLINFMMGVPDVKHLMNRRGNPQSHYHESGKTDQIFSQIWRGLSDFWKENHPNSPDLFPNEQIIFDSALFKASPFHRLTNEQSEAVDRIINIVQDKLNAFSKEEKSGKEPTHALILVAGAAGTGKTVLLSHLFYYLYDAISRMKGSDSESEIELIVNHDQQLTVYKNLCTKLGLAGGKASKRSKNSSTITAHVDKATEFINRKTDPIKGAERNKDDKSKMKSFKLHNYDKPTGIADVTLIDEAHLLHTQDGQDYQGGNQLYDIILRSKVTVAVFDPGQILQKRCDWSPELISVLFPEGQKGLSGSEFTDRNSSGSSKKQQDLASRIVDLPIIQMKNPKLDYWKKKYRGTAKNEPDGEKIDRHQLTVDVTNVVLTKQMRVSADPDTIEWIDNLVAKKMDDKDGKTVYDFGVVDPIPVDRGELRELEEDNYRNLDGSLSMPDPGRIEWKREPYEIKVFDSPVELFKAIYKKAVPNNMHRHEGGLSRVIATYDWAYTSGKVHSDNAKIGDPGDPCGFWNVEMTRNSKGDWNFGLSKDDRAAIDKDIAASEGHEGSAFVETFGEKAKDVAEPDQAIVDSMPTDRFCMPWNMELTKYASPSKDMKADMRKLPSDVEALEKNSKRLAPKKRQVQEDLSWAEQEHTVFEVGSTYTIQGFDLNVAGVIIGPSVQYCDGEVIYDPNVSKDSRANDGASEDIRKRNIRNQLNVLLKRGVHGLYLFAVDEKLRNKLRDEYAKYVEEKKRVDAQNKEDWCKRVKEFKRHLEAVQKQEEHEDEEEEASLE